MSIDTIVEKWAEMRASSPSSVRSTLHATVNHHNLAKAVTNLNALKNVSDNVATENIIKTKRVTAKNALKHKNKKSTISTRSMVKAAIKSQLKGPRSGVSYAAIKKFIAENYQTGKLGFNGRLNYIKKYIRNALANGDLVRSKPGNGLVGSFRFSVRKIKQPQTRRMGNQIEYIDTSKALKTQNTIKSNIKFSAQRGRSRRNATAKHNSTKSHIHHKIQAKARSKRIRKQPATTSLTSK